MKNAATLSSILKKHYTRPRRKVEMLTFMLLSIRALVRPCTRVSVHVRTHRGADKKKKKKRYRHNTAHSFSSSLTYPTSTRGMLSQIITGGLSLSLVAAACERAETTVGHSGGSALGGSESVSRDAGGGSGGDGGVEDLRLASYGPGNSS